MIDVSRSIKDYTITLRPYPMANLKEPENVRMFYELKVMRDGKDDVSLDIKGYNNLTTDLMKIREAITEMIRRISL